MKITRLSTFMVALPVPGGSYKISRGRDHAAFNSIIVVIETDSDLHGVGESCPFGAAYAAAFPGAINPAIAEIAPALIGRDPNPRSILLVYGKSVGLPVYKLLGSLLTESFGVRMGIPVKPVVEAEQYMENSRSEGFFQFNAKAGDDPECDVDRIRALARGIRPGELMVVDANGGWRADQAVYVQKRMAEFPGVVYEQPCGTYEECLKVRRLTGARIILDESITDAQSLLRTYKDEAADGVTLKINKIGGLTKTRLLRDVAVAMKIPAFIQDAWGSQIVDAAIAHLAHSTPPEFLLGGWSPKGHVGVETAQHSLVLRKGRAIASDGAGLGIEVKSDILSTPIGTYA